MANEYFPGAYFSVNSELIVSKEEA